MALAGSLGVARSAHAAGGDQLKVALIGCGGRGNGAAFDCLGAGDNIKIVAVADAFEGNAKGAADRLNKEFKSKGKADIAPDHVFVGLDAYKKAVDCGVDLVLLATPPGFRPSQYAYAIQAGKHVFMEKPCCVDAPGFRTLMEANKMADDKGLKVVVGLQRRHEAGYIDGVKKIHDGSLGDVLFQRVYWNGGPIWIRARRPGMTEMEFQVHNWYHFTWLSGDNIGEQHVHNLDVANWVKGDHPVEANGMGGCQCRNNRGIGQIFDHHFVEFTYKDGTKLFSQCRQQPNTWGGVFEQVHGTKGVGGPHSGKGGTNAYSQEHIDLQNAIRKNEKLNDGWHGATSSMTAVLGRMATYSGQVIKWDDAVAKGGTDMPEKLAWDAQPKVLPDKDGNYPVAVPGVYKPF
jgi:predicted dehydrogenase